MPASDTLSDDSHVSFSLASFLSSSPPVGNGSYLERSSMILYYSRRIDFDKKKCASTCHVFFFFSFFFCAACNAREKVGKRRSYNVRVRARVRFDWRGEACVIFSFFFFIWQKDARHTSNPTSCNARYGRVLLKCNHTVNILSSVIIYHKMYRTLYAR